MANETKAEMAARHDREMRQRMEAHESEMRLARAHGMTGVHEAQTRADQAHERADRMAAALMRREEQAAVLESKLDATRARVSDLTAERDVLRGFVFREIPLRLADLPAPMASALGVYTAGGA